MEIPLPIAGAAAPTTPELSFAIESAGALEHAAVPALRFGVRVDAGEGVAVRSVAMEVQIRIAATRRPYDARAQERLVELFGRPEQWDRSLRGLHWTNVTVHVPPFTSSTVVELHVPCTYDLEVVATRYFNALEDGHVPLEFLFSGTVFYADPDGRLQVGRIGLDQEADFRMPVATWREMINRHFPDTAWLRLRRDSFDRLCQYRARHTHLSWEEAVDALLRDAEEREK